jgi:hypothetical protein
VKHKLALSLAAFSLAASASLAFGEDAAQSGAMQSPTEAPVVTSTATEMPASPAVVKKAKKAKKSHKKACYQKQIIQVMDNKGLESKVYNLESRLNMVQQNQLAFQHNQSDKIDHLKNGLSSLASRFSHGMSVVASRFIGQRNPYDVNDLIVNLPSMNQDLRLLEQRQRLNDYALAHNEPIPNQPVIDLSGSVEGQALYTSDYLGASKTDVDLATAQFDLVAEVSPWITTAAFFNYENDSPVTGARISNSRVKLSRGFLTVGNLDKSPVYFTVGQIYVPFGLYSSFMVTTPVTATLAKVRTRAALLGIETNGFYGSLYAFRGDSFVSNNGIINQWGANAGYSGKSNVGFNYGFGAGYIANMADSEGMQFTGGSNFPGFSIMPAIQKLRDTVPGADVHFELGFNPFHSGLSDSPLNFVAEYVTAMRSFDARDLSFNNSGAKPSALNLELAYDFSIMGKHTGISAGAGHTWDSLALNIPEQSYYAALNSNIWEYTIESLEFRHDVNYSNSDVASGSSLGNFNPTGSRNRNVVTLKVGAYF